MDSLKPDESNCSCSAQLAKLRGGAKQATRVKTFATDDLNIATLLNILRPLNLFKLFDDHQKCDLVKKNSKEQLCKFCLIRSLMLKINQSKGRMNVLPLEFFAAFEELDSETLIEDIEFVICQINSIIPNFKEHFLPNWNCNECSDEDIIIDLTCEDSNQDLSILVNSYEQQVYKEHANHQGTVLKLSNSCTVLIFYSDSKMSVKFGKSLSFGGIKWKCKSFRIENDCYFATKEGFVKASNTSSFINNNDKVENVDLAVYEMYIENMDCNNENLFIYSGRNDNDILIVSPF